MIGDTPAQQSFSQHAGIWAILSGAADPGQAKKLMLSMLSDTTIGQATFFYRFYLVQALKKSGLGNLYHSQLQPWQHMLELGLTTFAEKPEPTRSDCHAWSASPDYDFLATLCGIMPDAPGFRKVRIKPSPGPLKYISVTMPHPDGEIALKLNINRKNGIRADIYLPPPLTGTFSWAGKDYQLSSGPQILIIP